MTQRFAERGRAGMRKQITVVLLALLGFAATGVALWAQQIQLGGLVGGSVAGPVSSSVEADAAKKGHVTLVTDALEVQAGKPQVLDLVFRVEPGFHINSHTPTDEFLIPTVFQPDAGGMKILSEVYPPGSAFQLSPPGAGSAGETLDVYQGEFRVRLRAIVPKGASILRGSLRYQACDTAACFPARTLPVQVALTAR